MTEISESLLSDSESSTDDSVSILVLAQARPPSDDQSTELGLLISHRSDGDDGVSVPVMTDDLICTTD